MTTKKQKTIILEIVFRGGGTTYIEVDNYNFEGNIFTYTYPANSKRKPLCLVFSEIVAIVELAD